MNLPLLLDTCAVIWLVEAQLGPRARQHLTDHHRAGGDVYVSPITAWELGISFSKRRLRSPLLPIEYFRRVSTLPYVQLAQMTPELLLNSSFLPDCTLRDPADRIIAATAREYGYTVLTSDRALLDYGKQGYLSVVEC